MATAQTLDKRKLLENHVLLGQLAPADLDKLVSYARVVRYRADDNIFLKGSPGSGMMAVISGRVKITAPSPDGKEVILNLINPGEIFGEIALLDGKERTADAVALTDCELLVLERRDFLPFLHARPELCVRLLAILCERLRRTSEQVEEILFLELPGRFARTLLRLTQSHGEKSAGGTRITLPLSQREFGEMVGISREGINKQLHAWQREGWITLDKGEIVIRNMAALRRAADPDLID
jgi:CRP/FNR family transcriptional regulator, cyclic AMP receptor protein